MKNIFIKICNIITTIFVVMFVAIAILLVGVKIVGLTPLSVLSGSMEPTYRTGSIIYVKKVEAKDIKVDEPITFYMNNGKTIATHRAIKIDSDNQLFYTKGDANNVQDPSPVPFSRLMGKPVFSIPYLGYLSAFIKTTPGVYISIAFIGLIILLMFIPSILKNKNQD